MAWQSADGILSPKIVVAQTTSTSQMRTSLGSSKSQPSTSSSSSSTTTDELRSHTTSFSKLLEVCLLLIALQSACLFVCLFVIYLSACISLNNKSIFDEISFCTCCLWVKLCPNLTTMWYSGSVDDVMCAHNSSDFHGVTDTVLFCSVL